MAHSNINMALRIQSHPLLRVMDKLLLGDLSEDWAAMAEVLLACLKDIIYWIIFSMNISRLSTLLMLVHDVIMPLAHEVLPDCLVHPDPDHAARTAGILRDDLAWRLRTLA